MLAKCGRDKEVLKPLRKALKDIETRDPEYGEPNYQVEMALVEVLISGMTQNKIHLKTFK